MKVAGAAAAAALVASAAAQDRTADAAQIVAVVDGIDRAVDARSWAEATAYFTPEVEVDFESLSGQPPATVPAETLTSGWAANLRGAKTSFHQRTNHLIEWMGGDAARVTSQGYAWNKLPSGGAPGNGGDPLWEVWGTYTHDLIRTEAGWRVKGMALDVAHQRGNDYVRDTPGDTD